MISLSFQQIAGSVSILIGWVTIVRWTRVSERETRRELERVFWTSHSVDRKLAVSDSSGAIIPDAKLVVRGVELYHTGWKEKYTRHRFRPVLLEESPRLAKLKDKVRTGINSKRNASVRFLSRIAYGMYRNVRPGARIWMESSVILEVRGCQIDDGLSNAEDNPYVKGSNLSHVKNVNRIDSNPDVYRIRIDTYKPDVADRAVRNIAPSEYVTPMELEERVSG